MKNEDERISKGLNQIFEVINAKGDVGELKKIVDESDHEETKAQNNE
jgi:hypothetical protein